MIGKEINKTARIAGTLYFGFEMDYFDPIKRMTEILNLQFS